MKFRDAFAATIGRYLSAVRTMIYLWLLFWVVVLYVEAVRNSLLSIAVLEAAGRLENK